MKELNCAKRKVKMLDNNEFFAKREVKMLDNNESFLDKLFKLNSSKLRMNVKKHRKLVQFKIPRSSSNLNSRSKAIDVSL